MNNVWLRYLILVLLPWYVISPEVSVMIPQDDMIKMLPAPSSRARLNLMIYFAGNNDLYPACVRQLEQMTAVGNLPEVNVLVQLDVFKENAVKRYLVADGKAVEMVRVDGIPLGVSGTPENLYDFISWGISSFPADSLYLFLSDHGDGIKDKELRSLEAETKGICFNSYAHCYLNNQDLVTVLSRVQEELLGGNQVPLLLADACYMSMIEICSQVRPYVTTFVGSQDVEPFLGYDYVCLLNRFKGEERDLFFNPIYFAKSAAACFLEYHKNSTKPITQSAIDVSAIEALEKNLAELGALLIECMNEKRGFFELLEKIRTSYQVTFTDPDYIDLYKFYESIVAIIKPKLSSYSHRRARVVELAEEGRILMSRAVLANYVGVGSKGASGLSIYFPQYNVHPSYYRTEFHQRTNWGKFLDQYRYHKFFRTA